MMKRIMIQADEELIARAKDAAHCRGVSVAQLVREALEKELGPARRPRTKLIGAFNSGETDVARRSARATQVPPRRLR
jgi:hypothetical protein